MLLYRLVCQTEFYFEQAAGSEKIYCNNTGFYFSFIAYKIIIFSTTVYQCVRKPLSEIVLSNETLEFLTHTLQINIGKTVRCSTYSAIAVHTGPVIIIHKTEYQAAVCQCTFTVRMFMV